MQTLFRHWHRLAAQVKDCGEEHSQAQRVLPAGSWTQQLSYQMQNKIKIKIQNKNPLVTFISADLDPSVPGWKF